MQNFFTYFSVFFLMRWKVLRITSTHVNNNAKKKKTNMPLVDSEGRIPIKSIANLVKFSTLRKKKPDGDLGTFQ